MMAWEEMLVAVASAAIGLLLGSVLPAGILARARGIDIRSVGDGNPGTVNAFRELGPVPGAITGLYDMSVGVLAIQIALLLGSSEGAAYAAGLMSVVGHRFPVFGAFRGGGQGMGASAGLLLYGVGVALLRGWLSALDLGILVAILLVTWAITRRDRYLAVVLLPVLVVRLFLSRPEWQYLALMTIVAVHIWVVQLAAVLARPRLSPAERARPTHE